MDVGWVIDEVEIVAVVTRQWLQWVFSSKWWEGWCRVKNKLNVDFQLIILIIELVIFKKTY